MPRFEVRKLSECNGCENYSEILDVRDPLVAPGDYHNCLVDVQENKIVYTECPEDLSLLATLLNEVAPKEPEVVTAKTLSGLLSEAFAAGAGAGVDYEKNIDAWHPSVLSGWYVKDVLVSLGFEQ